MKQKQELQKGKSIKTYESKNRIARVNETRGSMDRERLLDGAIPQVPRDWVRICGRTCRDIVTAYSRLLNGLWETKGIQEIALVLSSLNEPSNHQVHPIEQSQRVSSEDLSAIKSRENLTKKGGDLIENKY